MATPARATAVQIENEIRLDALETGVFIGADGLILLRRQGLPDQITYSFDELLAMRDTTFTHNHPGGGGLSVADVAVASEFGFREVRAVTRLFRFEISRLSLLTAKQWQTAYDHEQISHVGRFAEWVRTGQLHYRDYGFEIQHQVWKNLSRRMHFLYRRELS